MADYDFSPPSESEKKEIQSKYNFAPPTPEELAKLKEGTEGYSTGQQIKDFGRTLAQGATLGFSDEAIAYARSVLEGKKYEETVKEEREALERYSKEHPYIATGAEFVGGIAPALLTGGASAVAEAGVGLGIKAAAMQAAKQGAKFGAATALGKTEQLAEKPMEALKEVALGAATGGVLGGAIGGGVQTFGKILPTITEGAEKLGFKRPVTAFKYAQQTGKSAAEMTEESSSRLIKSAENLTDELKIANKIARDRKQTFIDGESEKGIKITTDDLSKSQALPTLREFGSQLSNVTQFIPTNERPILENFISKIQSQASGSGLMGGVFSEFTPTEIDLIKKTIDKTLNTSVIDNPNIAQSLKSNMIDSVTALRKVLEDKLGDNYKSLNNTSSSLYKAFESLLDKGGPSISKYNSGNINNRPAKLQNAIEDLIANYSNETTGSDWSRKAMSDFKNKFRDLFNKEMDLMEKTDSSGKKIVDPKQSIFAKLNEEGEFLGFKDPETFLNEMIESSKVQDVRKAMVGIRPVEGASVKGIWSKIKDVGSEEQMLNIASQLGKQANTSSTTSKVLSAGSSLFSSDVSSRLIGELSSHWLSDPKTKRYGEALRQAEIENDKNKKNATLFAAMQNPVARPAILESQSSIERSPATSDELSDEYISNRNKFITRQETGPEAAEQEEFNVYKDTGGKRTIGHGFNLDAPGQYELMKKTLGLSPEEAKDIYTGQGSISKEQAEKLFNISANKAERELEKKVGPALSKLNPNQRAALVSMMYNSPKLIGPKILNALKSGNYDEVARLIGVTSDWQAEQHPGLPIRRRNEADLFSGSSEE